MKISFNKSKISNGPLAVLNHLYYYIVQYGLSVKQSTGRHQDYWRALPAVLNKLEHNPRKLKKVISELEIIAEGHEERLRKKRMQLKKWPEKEIIINAQLVSILAALPDTLVPIVFKCLTGIKNSPQEYRVAELKIEAKKGENKDFVEPDLLLWGEKEKHLLMVETKTRGSLTSSRSYPVQQLLNYTRLALECQNSNDKNLPNQFSHLILVPTTNRKWLENHSKWVLKKRGKDAYRIYVDPNACIKFGNSYTKKHSKDIRRLLREIPIYYYSWGQLARALDSALMKFDNGRNRKHWDRIGDELKDLAEAACAGLKKET